MTVGGKAEGWGGIVLKTLGKVEMTPIEIIGSMMETPRSATSMFELGVSIAQRAVLGRDDEVS